MILKKTIYLLIAMVLALSLFVGCTPVQEDDVSGIMPPPVEDIDSTTDKQDPTPETKPEEKPSTSPETDPGTNPTPKPETKPETKPDPKPETKPAVTPSDIWNAIETAFDGGIGTMSAVDDTILNDMYGISSDDLESYVGKMPVININAEEFLIAKVKDGKMNAVKAGIASRVATAQKALENYLPDQLELVKNHQVIVNGNYVLFVISENASKAVDAFNKLTK